MWSNRLVSAIRNRGPARTKGSRRRSWQGQGEHYASPQCGRRGLRKETVFRSWPDKGSWRSPKWCQINRKVAVRSTQQAQDFRRCHALPSLVGQFTSKSSDLCLRTSRGQLASELGAFGALPRSGSGVFGLAPWSGPPPPWCAASSRPRGSDGHRSRSDDGAGSGRSVFVANEPLRRQLLQQRLLEIDIVSECMRWLAKQFKLSSQRRDTQIRLGAREVGVNASSS